MKDHNILKAEGNIERVSALYFCGELACRRTIVTYDGQLEPTRHADGLTPDTIAAVVVHRVPIIPTRCDKHGGVELKAAVSYTSTGVPQNLSAHIIRAIQGGYDLDIVDILRHELANAGVNPMLLDIQTIQMGQELRQRPL